MAKQLCLSVVVEMPDDNPFDAADVYTKLKQPWSDLLNCLQQIGVQHTAKLDELAIRSRTKRGPRKTKEKAPKQWVDTSWGSGAVMDEPVEAA